MLLGLLALLALPFLALFAIGELLEDHGGKIVDSFKNGYRKLAGFVGTRRQRAAAAADEAWRDQKQMELRHTILRLADHLGADAHEARKALIRESYLASGKLPDPPS